MSKYTVTIGEKVWQVSGATYIAVALGIIAILAAAMIGLIHIGGMWLLVGCALLTGSITVANERGGETVYALIKHDDTRSTLNTVCLIVGWVGFVFYCMS